jgi:hypothetical protein
LGLQEVALALTAPCTLNIGEILDDQSFMKIADDCIAVI